MEQKSTELEDSNKIEMKDNLDAYKKLKGNRKNTLLFMHNHPSTSTFSGEDFKTFCNNDSLYIITIVGNDGSVQTLTKTKSFDKAAALSFYHHLAIRNGEAGLTERRKNILYRVPNSNDWAAFEKDSVTIKDIAYLSAATHHEFALLRGKKKDIVFHGVERHCNFNDDLLELLKVGKLRLVAHTHPDYDSIRPSSDDRRFLQYIHQEESLIVSYITGNEKKFSAYYFEDLYGEG